MKRKKRDSSARAFSRGYLAGAAGKSRSICPHTSGEVRQDWLTGWREGREDHWAGYNTMAHAHRLHL